MKVGEVEPLPLFLGYMEEKLDIPIIPGLDT